MRRFSITPRRGLRLFDSAGNDSDRTREPDVHVIRAQQTHANIVARLFDEYRQFYQQESDPERARRFIGERLRQDDSIIFLAQDAPEPPAEALGFAQLYPCFSSVATCKILILNDLYVRPAARRGGVGLALLCAAREHARVTGARRVQLETATNNRPAQQLYEQFGFVEAERHLTYLYDL